MVLSRGWYVATNRTPFSTFVLWKTLRPENLTLLVSVSMSFCGYPLYENHDFISQIWFSKYFSSEQIRLGVTLLYYLVGAYYTGPVNAGPYWR